MTVVLASSSSARRRMLEQAGVAALCDAADIDEAAVKRRDGQAAAATIALDLAELKARAVTARHPGALVIGSDQMLDCEGEWFDKPESMAEARSQLARLRGRTHTLISAVAIVRDDTVLWRHCDSASLTMRPFSDAYREDYLAAAGPDVCRTVGCYRIEGPGLQLFSRVDGDHFVILGMPLLALLGALRDLGELKS